MKEDYEALKAYANDREREKLSVLQHSRSQKEAAKKLGINRRTLERSLERVRRKAASQGYCPESGYITPAPAGFLLKKTTAQYDPEGNLKQAWHRFHMDSEQWESTKAAMVEALNDDIKTPKPIPFQGGVNNDFLNLFVVTDYHLGMHSWGEQTGADWDTKIAESLLVNWFAEAIRRSETASTAILAQLGDFFHYDSLKSITPSSGHLLDSDTRYQRMISVGIRVLKSVVEMLLKKHKKVHIIMAEGNHDEASSAALREMMAIFMASDPRVTVDTSADPYYCYEFGQNTLFFHHGHKRNPKNIDDVMVAKFREEYGRTKHSWAHLGHLHHKHMLETNLMVVEQHQTLAAPDAYASAHGWMSGRSAQCITYHKDHGEWSRVTISPSQIQG